MMSKTPKLFHAIIIDPKAQSVERIEIEGTLSAIKTHIDGALTSFRIADHETHFDYGWIDDVGLARGSPVHAFQFDNRNHPFAGRCLIIGVDKETRDATDVGMTLAFVTEHVEWLGLILPKVTPTIDGNTTRLNVTYERLGG